MAVVSRPMVSAPSARERRALWMTPLLTVVVYALALLVASLLFQRAAAQGQRWVDDLRYGTPRTVHLSGVMLAGDTAETPTQIVALNLRGQISLLLFPAGDSRRVQTLTGPYIFGRDGADAVPLVKVSDINGDGAADLVMTIRDEAVVYLNKDGQFTLLTPEERTQLVGQGERP